MIESEGIVYLLHVEHTHIFNALKILREKRHRTVNISQSKLKVFFYEVQSLLLVGSTLRALVECHFVLYSKGNNNHLSGHNPGLEYVINIGKRKKKSCILY